MDDQRADRESGGGINDAAKQRQFRFSLKALLIGITFLAALIGAYIAGYKNGNKDGYWRGVGDNASLAKENNRPIVSLPSPEEWSRITREHVERQEK